MAIILILTSERFFHVVIEPDDLVIIAVLSFIFYLSSFISFSWPS